MQAATHWPFAHVSPAPQAPQLSRSPQPSPVWPQAYPSSAHVFGAHAVTSTARQWPGEEFSPQPGVHSSHDPQSSTPPQPSPAGPHW
jgi:hypothetical protein